MKALFVRLLPYGLALLFLAAGVAKLLRLDFEVEAFARYGLPLWLMTLVGTAEAVAAGLLVGPRTATAGAILAAAMMVVAIPAHLVAGEYALAPFSAFILALLIWLGWSRRAEFVDLIR